jgi:UDP-2,3-diacylglucosamine pyrophosphatase LpxH
MTDRILVICDLHLHTGSDPKIVEDFSRLLKQSTAQRLVINGDLFDLDQVSAEKEAGRGMMRARRRVGQVLDSFNLLTTSLKDWAADKKSITWIPGNHDAELWHPIIQQEIRNRLNLGVDQLTFAESYTNSNGIHIEHGHQHDPDNHFFPATAQAIAKRRLSAFPLGCLITRFLLCHIPNYAIRGDNHLTPLAVLIRTLARHKWATPKLIGMYVLSAFLIANQARLANIRQDTGLRPDGTRFTFFGVLNRMYIDRVFMTMALVSVLVLFILGTISLKPAIIIGLPCAILLLFQPSRRHQFKHRDRIACRQAAREHFDQDTRLLIMGHTHHAENLSTYSSMYLNPGAFMDKKSQGRPYIIIMGTTGRIGYIE